MTALFRRIFSVVLVGVLGIIAPAPAAAADGPGADIAVGLDAFGSFLLAGARYDVAVTNNGPETLTAATVVVRIDPRALTGGGPRPPCPMDAIADTLTCSFGPVAAGATVTLSAWVYFSLPQERHVTVEATATRTASTPADPDPSNDSATTTCAYSQYPSGTQFNDWRLFC